MTKFYQLEEENIRNFGITVSKVDKLWFFRLYLWKIRICFTNKKTK